MQKYNSQFFCPLFSENLKIFYTNESTIVKSYKLNFDDNGTGYKADSSSVRFLREDGTTSAADIKLNTKSKGLCFVRVTKTDDCVSGKESVDFYISKW